MIVIGLGNPGEEYKNTYHNMGYRVVDALAEKLNKKVNKIECSALTGVASVAGEKFILAKPLTYMNNSGLAVKSLLARYEQTLDDLIVAYDDADIDRFSVRVREKGSAGTHNGMKSVIELLGTDDFIRVRMGIGKTDRPLIDYVLDRISPEDDKVFSERAASVADLILEYCHDGDVAKLMRNANVIK